MCAAVRGVKEEPTQEVQEGGGREGGIGEEVLNAEREAEMFKSVQVLGML